MAKKTALVLSGGGAKGAFQMAAEKYAREEKGYQWDLIAGVSVGALNGMMLAMEKYARLEALWRNITREQVYTGKLKFWSLLKIAFGAKSVYDNAPLWEIIQREYEPEKVRKDLKVGTVSLKLGKYIPFMPSDPGFENAVLASTAIPVIWSPVDVSPVYKEMVDGGVRNISPLGDVLDSDPDEVVIINCDPVEPPVRITPFRNAVDIGIHTIEIMMNEILTSDIREFIRINRNVNEATAANVQLHNEKGRVFKAYEYKLIQPDEILGDTLDFSREAIEMRMDAGWEKANEVLG
ncbi:MAG: patatin-like phospholipase family protein [Anaerolineales bacterium]|jgi:NTE family protein